jgi:hypothetical protein
LKESNSRLGRIVVNRQMGPAELTHARLIPAPHVRRQPYLPRPHGILCTQAFFFRKSFFTVPEQLRAEDPAATATQLYRWHSRK